MSDIIVHDCGQRLRVPERSGSGRVRCPKCKAFLEPLSYYSVLGVAPSASAQAIAAAYRRIARNTHPDLTGSNDSSAFRRATEAYSVLSDQKQRANYDRSGRVDENALAARRDEILAAVESVRRAVAQARAKARTSSLRGAAWLVGGSAVTGVAYASAAPGDRVPVFWGAILFGALQAVRGQIAAFRIRRAGAAMEQDLWAHLAA